MKRVQKAKNYTWKNLKSNKIETLKAETVITYDVRSVPMIWNDFDLYLVLS